MQTQSPWPDNSANGKEGNGNGTQSIPHGASSSTNSMQTPGGDNTFMKYMRPMGPQGPGGCYTGHRSPCSGQYRMPHPRHGGHYPMYYPGHVPMMPVYYPHGPPRVPPHMMFPYRHPHMGYVPVPPYGYYPYPPGSRFGSPRSAVPSTHSWNEYKHSMQRSAANRSPARSSRGNSPRCSESAKNANSQKGKSRQTASAEAEDRSFGSDSQCSDEDFGSLTEEESKRRSKYRTLLRELAVNENPAPVFNSTVKPQTLRQAICMYIDFLTVLNEGRVRVEEFNNAPLMEPGFEYEDYYHEALNENVHFPSSTFKNWLAGYGVSIEVTDDPDGNDPGEKIVVITNLGKPKTTMGNPTNQENMTNNNSLPQNKKPTSSVESVGNFSLPQETNTTQNLEGFGNVPESNVQDPFSVVNKVTETIDEGCVITLIEDDEDSQETKGPTFGSSSGMENAFVPGMAKHGLSNQGVMKNHTTKRKSRYDSQDTYVMNNYLPPRKSCIDKRGEKAKLNKAGTVRQQRSKTSTPAQDDFQHNPFIDMQSAGQGAHGIPYSTAGVYFEDTNVNRHTLDANAVASDCPAHNSQNGNNFMCNVQSNLNNLPESVTSTLPITADGFNDSQDINNGIVSCQPFQPMDEQNFLSFNQDFQRGLHTPIFGNTPMKEYGYHTQEQQSAFVQMNDPVLIETAGKRRKISTGVNEFMSDESSRDTTGSGDLDGIHVLSPVLAMRRSAQLLQYQKATVSHNHPPSATVGMDYACPFTTENLASQVQDAMASVGVLNEDCIGQNGPQT